MSTSTTAPPAAPAVSVPPPAEVDELVKKAETLTLDGLSSDSVTKELIHEKYPDCHVNVNPLDLYRIHLTETLSSITGVDRAIAYRAIQWTTGLDKGDFVVAAPALRVKGKKPDELAAEIGGKVRQPCSLGKSPVLTE
jgi:arginyl-tRNA synthetase